MQVEETTLFLPEMPLAEWTKKKRLASVLFLHRSFFPKADEIVCIQSIIPLSW